jgi:hypothetical protein
MGRLHASNGFDYSYSGPTWISLNAFAENVEERRSEIVKYLNISRENAEDLVFHDRDQFRLATLESISHSCQRKDDASRLAEHVYDVMGQMVGEPDPFLAGFPLVCLKNIGYWSPVAFGNAIKHNVEAVRAEAIRYFESMHESISTAERLDAMTIMVTRLDDPHLGIRQLANSSLKGAYLFTCRYLSEDSPERNRAAALQEAWLDDVDEARKRLDDAARANIHIWQERIAALRKKE